MTNRTENMEIGGGEEVETDYFQGVTKCDDSLDLSIDSLQGSMTLPTFTVGQSSDLQGSQGFQISNLAFPQRSDNHGSYKVISDANNTPEPSGHSSNLGHMTSPVGHVTPGLSLQGNTLIFQGNQFGALNVMQPADHYRIVLPNDVKELNTGQQIGELVPKSETSDTAIVNEVFEGGSSDEKSGRCKTSPKRRGRKSRSTSSTGNETLVKTEAVPGPSPCRMDTSEQQQPSGDMGFKPSLLDEILTDKKLALMRSPEVVQFLQSQQQQAREKNLTHKQSTAS